LRYSYARLFNKALRRSILDLIFLHLHALDSDKEYHAVYKVHFKIDIQSELEMPDYKECEIVYKFILIVEISQMIVSREKHCIYGAENNNEYCCKIFDM